MASGGVAVGADAGDGEVVQVRLEVELGGEGVAEFVEVVGGEVVGAGAGAADHVMMAGVRVGDFEVEAVADGYFGDDAHALEEVEGAVDGGDVHVWVGLAGLAEDCIDVHVAAALGDGVEDEEALGGEADASTSELLEDVLLGHVAMGFFCKCLRLPMLSGGRGMSRWILP